MDEAVVILINIDDSTSSDSTQPVTGCELEANLLAKNEKV